MTSQVALKRRKEGSGRGGCGLVVIELAFYSNGLTSNPLRL